MIVGRAILDKGIIIDGDENNLKNSTYDLTIGEIVPIGKNAVNERQAGKKRNTYYLEPREMLWVLSKESFKLPKDVTGLATLRTTFTKEGILALNVGIIDPFFEGPISTALINFSDKARRLEVGEKFFRVAFFEHDDVTKFHRTGENVSREAYIKTLEDVSYTDFSPSFMNIPSFDDEYYYSKFWKVLYLGFIRNKWVSIPLALILSLLLIFQIHLGLGDFIWSWLTWIKVVWDKLPFVS